MTHMEPSDGAPKTGLAKTRVLWQKRDSAGPVWPEEWNQNKCIHILGSRSLLNVFMSIICLTVSLKGLSTEVLNSQIYKKG